MQSEDEKQACLLIIQCDFSHADGDLIACARYRIYDMRAKALLEDSSGPRPATHVLFIIHLPVQAVQTSFVGFQGDPWVSCHIDELRKSKEGALTLEVAQGALISELFYGGPKRNQPPLSEVEEVFDSDQSKQDDNGEKVEEGEGREEDMLKECPISTAESQEGNEEAAFRVQISTDNTQEATKRVELLIPHIPQEPSFPLGEWHPFQVSNVIHMYLNMFLAFYQEPISA